MGYGNGIGPDSLWVLLKILEIIWGIPNAYQIFFSVFFTMMEDICDDAINNLLFRWTMPWVQTSWTRESVNSTLRPSQGQGQWDRENKARLRKPHGGTWLQPTQFIAQALWTSSLPKHFPEEIGLVREPWKGRKPKIKISLPFLGATPVF